MLQVNAAASRRQSRRPRHCVVVLCLSLRRPRRAQRGCCLPLSHLRRCSVLQVGLAKRVFHVRSTPIPSTFLGLFRSHRPWPLANVIKAPGAQSSVPSPSIALDLGYRKARIQTGLQEHDAAPSD
uniref:Uncharacterized protein n=1 Tax=Setaria viridis TaxID=4556 RepID=A0A4U6UHS4_SETVI|nr:hypothetical protein SEVIR_5G200666v2 [Setaria viridis]